MKSSPSFPRLGGLFLVPFLAAAPAFSPGNLRAADPRDSTSQQTFASPDDAVKALKAAVEDRDKAALEKVFGPEIKDLSTGDPVQDANNRKRFASLLDQGYQLENEGDSKVIVDVGPDNWPMPIPLVKSGSQWRFDTDAGKEEVIDRHIGKDELHAIGVCRDYVKAQRQYAEENPQGASGTAYAMHLKSASGKKDGLYWPVSGDESASPFGPVIAEAQSEGYTIHKQGTGPHAFHGYYFHVLTAQGSAAPGGAMSYVADGRMTKGFALIAYPDRWDKSGIMTFIVNQDGKVYQKNLGEDTATLAPAIKEFNPTSDWTLVQDEGILRAVSEK
jgi:hypothetical protein